MACSRVNFTSLYLQARIRNAGSEHMLLHATRSEKIQKTVTRYAATNGTYNRPSLEREHELHSGNIACGGHKEC